MGGFGLEKGRRKIYLLLALLGLALAFGGGVVYGQYLVFRDSSYALAEVERRGIVMENVPAEEPANGDGAEEETAAAEPPGLGAEEEGGGLVPGDTVGINSADAATLELLPGIGPKKAAAIVAYREEKGAFQSLADLMAVPGIGDAIFAKIEPYLTLE